MVQDTALETFDKKYSQVNGNSERNDQNSDKTIYYSDSKVYMCYIYT